MVKQALLDTDTISYFFRKEPKVVSKVDDYLQVFGYVNVSVVTYYEVLNGLYFKDAKRQLEQFQSFTALNQVIPLTEACAELAARTYATLRATGISIGHNDVMIASTAMTYDFSQGMPWPYA
jgi:tRNA(fMet)-specific endonuclease VapC